VKINVQYMFFPSLVQTNFCLGRPKLRPKHETIASKHSHWIWKNLAGKMVSEGTDYRTRRRPWVLLVLSNCQRNWRERGRRCRCALDDGEMSCVNAGVLVGPARRHRRLRRHRHRLAGQCRERYVHVRVIARLYIVAHTHTHTHTHVNRVLTADFIVT